MYNYGQNSTLNVNPKVAAPAFVGFTASIAVCIARHYNLPLDPGTAAGVIVVIMTAIGWLVPNGSKQLSSTTTTTTTTGGTTQ